MAIHQEVFKLLLTAPNPGNCIALYAFSYYNTEWIDGKTEELQKILGWGTKRTRNTIKMLTDLGLIETKEYKRG